MDNKKLLVRSVFGFLIFGSSFLFWLVFQRALQNGSDLLAASFWSLAFFLILGSLISLVYLVENGKKFLYAVPLAIILPFMFFYKWGNWPEFAVAIAAVFFFLLAVRRVEFEKISRIRIAAGIIFKKGLRPTITGLALLATLLFYWAPYSQSLGQEISVPRPLFDAVANPIVNFLITSNLPAENSSKVPPVQLEQVRQQSLDSVYQSINEQISVAGKTYKKWIPLGLSISIFFSFKILGVFLSWFIIAVTWLIFRLLLLLKVVNIKIISTEKEIIEI